MRSEQGQGAGTPRGRGPRAVSFWRQKKWWGARLRPAPAGAGAGPWLARGSPRPAYRNVLLSEIEKFPKHFLPRQGGLEPLSGQDLPRDLPESNVGKSLVCRSSS